MYAQLKDKSIVEVEYYDNVDGENLYRDVNNSTLHAGSDIIKIILNGSEAIRLFKDATAVVANNTYPFTTEICQSMNEYIENIIKKSDTDWSGCQGTCDFEKVPNLNGWI